MSGNGHFEYMSRILFNRCFLKHLCSNVDNDAWLSIRSCPNSAGDSSPIKLSDVALLVQDNKLLALDRIPFKATTA